MLARILRSYRKPAAPDPAAPREPQEPALLRRMLLTMGRVNGQGEALRLMVDAASCDIWRFYTQHDVGEGDELILETLLSSLGNLTLRARVKDLRRTNRGLSGELWLQTDDEQRLALREFFQREAA